MTSCGQIQQKNSCLEASPMLNIIYVDSKDRNDTGKYTGLADVLFSTYCGACSTIG